MRSTYLFFLVFIFVCLGCRESVDSSGTINNGNGEDPPLNQPDDVAGFYVRVYKGQDINYYMHKEGSDFSAECRIDVGETVQANKDIKCIVDIPEEDLQFHGLKLQYNVPTQMCEYLHFMPYYFENYEVGVGISLLRYDIDQFGNIGVDLNNDFDVLDAGEALAGPATSGLSGTTPTCVYDYSENDGPNCCLGRYTLIARTYDAGSGGYITAAPQTGEWGGDYGACIYGPAIATQPLTSDGIPLADIEYVKGIGLNKAYEPPTPLSKLAGTIYLANYYDPDDHPANDMPAALVSTQDSYDFQCLDRARELKARIQVFVREWNQYSQWELGASGDPDTTGNEPNFPTFPINDFWDWLNYQDTFPQLEKN